MNGDERMVDYERMENIQIDNEMLDTQEQIIKMVGKIENLWILEQILLFIHNMVKED